MADVVMSGVILFRCNLGPANSRIPDVIMIDEKRAEAKSELMNEPPLI